MRSDSSLNASFVSGFEQYTVDGMGNRFARDLRLSATKRLRGTDNVLGSVRSFAYNYESDTVPNGLDRLIGESSAETPALLDRNFTYDSRDNLQTVTSLPAQVKTTHTLNDNNQITQSVTVPTDANGTPIAGPTTTTSFRTDYRGNLLGYVNGTASFTDSGNRPRDVEPDPSRFFDTLYEYNSLDQLIAVESRAHTTIPSEQIEGELNSLRSEFYYDAFGRRRTVRELEFVSTNPANPALGGNWVVRNTTNFIYDGMQIIQERDGSNVTQVQLGWGLGMEGGAGALLHRSVKNGAAWRHYFATSDISGNVAQLIRKDTGAVVARYDYDAYGGLSLGQGLTTGDAIDMAQANGNSYRTQSKWTHAQSSLIDFGYRFYSPGLARWLNRDPLGEAGGLNLYGYVSGDPVNIRDPHGLSVINDWKKSINDFLFGKPKPCPEDDFEAARQMADNTQHGIRVTATLTKKAYKGMYEEAPKMLMMGSLSKGVEAAAAAREALALTNFARKVRLNAQSPTTKVILNNLDNSVAAFIGSHRRGSIRAEFPTEYMNVTLREALLKGGSDVRKLLVDQRFLK